jgi:hypothetical protein
MKLVRIMLVAFAMVAPACARDVFVDNMSGYTIDARILDAPNCSGPAFSDVTLEQFEKGLCVFHRSNRSLEDSDAVLNLMSQAQTRGLPPVHQQLSTLISGLAGCASAQSHLDSYKATNNQDLLEKAYFCRNRRQAQADFQSIMWNHALFEYADGLGTTRNLDSRINEMAACQAGVLAPSLDSECGLISNMSETEINAFVDTATDDTIKTYFSGVESPVTAMFSRKLKRAEGLLESAQGNIAELKVSADGVNSEYKTLNQAYVAARDQKMSQIYDAYRASILRSAAILDEFNRWKGGLFFTAENVNLLPKITERSGEIQQELKLAEDSGFKLKAQALTGQIRRIVNGAEEDKATIATLCRVFFCEIAQRRSMPGLIRACRHPALASNPLCVGQDGQMINGTLRIDFNGAQTISVTDLCRSAGLDPSFTVVDMTPVSSAACLSVSP